MKYFNAVIIGAGASGLMCAAEALRRGKSVAVIEHNAKPLRKVSISGGGNCNFTNLAADASHYISSNPKFCISALRQFSPQDMLDFINRHHIKTYQKTPGRYFCLDGAQTLINALIKEASGAEFFYNTVFKDIIRSNNSFIIKMPNFDIKTDALVIACGGMSYANLGASADGFKTAKSFGHKIIPCRPALTPLNLDSSLMKSLRPLQGISLPVTIKTGLFTCSEDMLFTHFGISGPAILQASLFWQKGMPLYINFLPQTDVYTYLKKQKETSKQKINTVFKTFFPQKFIDYILQEPSRFLAEISDKKLREIASRINNWQVTPVSAKGYDFAEVTAGGVDTEEISSQTMESKLIKNLYFTGEVIDVTGQLGGFNLQWAFSSGYVAGKNL